MRLFNAKIMDRRLDGGGAFTLASDSWSCLLSRAEALKFFFVVDQVSGAAPAFGALLIGSGAPDFNMGEFPTKMLAGETLSAGTNMFQGDYSSADPGWPPPKHLLVWVYIDGEDTSARFQVWVCGRGPERIEETAATPTFAAQLAAARMCNDEDRLVGRKHRLRPGQSVFYPPDLFDPSLKWDR